MNRFIFVSISHYRSFLYFTLPAVLALRVSAEDIANTGVKLLLLKAIWQAIGCGSHSGSIKSTRKKEKHPRSIL